MKFRIIAAAALAFAATGAMAQTDQQSTPTDSQWPQASRAAVAPFYTDSSMKTMRDEAGFTAAMKNLKSEDREAIKNECANRNTMNTSFCDQYDKNSAM
ncbi:hypothetical protein NGM99_05185 [Mesorhizobium sp. RP14(2022)]|uniref:Uncharacterized protein n=1 Tax=Mesorhizobium liriopis TaxID=2953882 RepID=A0ABT1C2X7_9HYPH|nr:hypothetical protein [Mesorhizobium liriopis]MCO6049182.1 hypothetical protein [Mesorhizobium liriopis]